MKSSSNDDGNNEQRQKSEHSYPSDPSNINMDNQHVNIAALPHHYSLPRYVDHTYYRDFSTYIKDGNRIEKHKKCDRNFPALVHSILSNDQYSHIISWMPHGRAWKIHDKDLLMEEVAPKFFGQSKYASFARQLSGWGFKRLHQTGADFGCYYHECFLRGHPKLTVLMRRVSPGQGKGTPDTNAEPDFYTIAEHFPLLEESSNANGAGTDDEGGVKKSGATFSESENIQKTDFLDDVDIDLGLDDGGPDLSRHTSSPSMGVSHHHEWDPYQYQYQYQPVGGGGGAAAHYYPPFPHPQHHLESSTRADLKEHDDHSTDLDHSIKRHSFASTATATDADKERNDSKDKDNDTVKEPHFDDRKHDTPPETYHQRHPRPIPHRERGYSDPFPTSIPQPLYSNANAYPNITAMHRHKNQAQQHQTPYHRPGPNINQYAQSHSSSQRSSYAAVPMSTMVTAPPYYQYPTPTPFPPQYHHYTQHSSSQYQDSHSHAHIHGSNMPDPNYEYTHRYPHYSIDHYQGTSEGHGSDHHHHHVQGYFLPPPPPPARGHSSTSGSTVYTAQAQAYHPSEATAAAVAREALYQNHGLQGPHPSFFPLRTSSRDEHNSEND